MELCMALAGSFGMAREIPEKLIDAVGAVSGSSPAFVFMFIEALADSAVKAGMTRKDAYHFAAQAVFGSAKLMLETGQLTKDVGSVLVGKQAVEEGVINEVGGIKDAFGKLRELIEKESL